METRIVVRQDDGIVTQFGDLAFTTIVGRADFEGGCSIFRVSLEAGCLAAPLHTHHHEDAFSCVLAGRFGFQVGDRVVEVTPGTVVLQPRGVPHTFWNAGDEPGRLLDIAVPGGLEGYYEELSDLLGRETVDVDRALEIANAYGLEADWDSIERLLAEHNLRFAPS